MSSVRIFLKPAGERWVDVQLNGPLGAWMGAIMLDRWLLTPDFAFPVESIHSIFVTQQIPSGGVKHPELEPKPASVTSLFGGAQTQNG